VGQARADVQQRKVKGAPWACHLSRYRQTSLAARLTGEETERVPKERKRRYEEDTLEFLFRRFGVPGETTPARASVAGGSFRRYRPDGTYGTSGVTLEAKARRGVGHILWGDLGSLKFP
jgi:hypothetical protein